MNEEAEKIGTQVKDKVKRVPMQYPRLSGNVTFQFLKGELRKSTVVTHEKEFTRPGMEYYGPK